MVNTMGWNERSDPDMRTANFCDVYREGVRISQKTREGVRVRIIAASWMIVFAFTLIRDSLKLK